MGEARPADSWEVVSCEVEADGASLEQTAELEDPGQGGGRDVGLAPPGERQAG